MISNRKFRLVGVAVVALLVVLMLISANQGLAVTSAAVLDSEVKDAHKQTLITSNNLIDSNNDDKVDAAINNEISKLTDATDDDKPKKVVEKEGVKAQDPLTKANPEQDFDATKEYLEIRALSPMVVFAKTYCPYSKKLKKLLHDNYEITPEFTVVELDKHSHGAELQEYLKDITGRGTVPNVLIGRKNLESRGGADDFVKLHEEGKLLEMLNTWGDKEIVVKRADAPSNL